MATSGKFNMSSASTDRPLYTSGLRGSYLASHLDRSASFREGKESPMPSSLSNANRSSSAVVQGDIMNFFRCLHFDPKMVAADHKPSRQGDFKRNIDVALGISMDEYAFLKSKISTSCIPEEIKRVKAGLCESSDKARERVKIFNEALSVFNKFFPSVPLKKRSRLEGFSGDRAGGLLSSDRPAITPGLVKTGFQNHVVMTSTELEQQKLGERTRNAFPNKRTRTSLVDVRSNTQVKLSGMVDRDREMPRPTNSSTIQAEDRTNLTIAVDSWEKSKMKKKRSGIKPDASTRVAAAKQTDRYHEPKPGLHQKPVTDSRSRLNIDSHGLRLGVANGAVGVGKSDGVAQPTSLNMRSAIPRSDLENGAFPSEKKEHPAGSDRDRINFKSVNKANVRDDFNSATPTSSTKMNATVRAPRSGTGAAPKSSPVVPRATTSNDWELSHCANKPAALGAKNRKRSVATRSSSPPVTQWAGQRPQKISRTARRTNLIPVVPHNDETADLDSVSDVSGNEIGVESAGRLTMNSPQQVKMKVEPSSAALSESEESGAPENKSKEKGKRSEETDDKVGQNVQKLSTLGMTSRKNKLVLREDVGDGVRRQGRTGRGFPSTRSVAPVGVEKLGNVGTAKQLRSARLGFDKSESKPGRPPTRKLSDRKAYKCQKHAASNVSADFLGDSDDGNEELLAAASSVVNPDHAACTPFWREMEPFFGFTFDDDIAYLKQQGNTELPSPTSDVNNCRIVHNGYGSVEDEKKGGLPFEISGLELPQKSMLVARDISLFQRLITAIIPEDDSFQESGDVELGAYGTGFDQDKEPESNSPANHDNFLFSGCTFNMHKPSGKPGKDEAEFGIMEIPTTVGNSIFSPTANGILLEQSMIPSIIHSELLYDDLQINEKLHLEIRSIGISIEPMVEDGEVEDGGIIKEISNLEEKFRRRALKKKSLLDKLLKSALDAKELQEKEFEKRAHDKLVTMAYEKYMACRGPHATGGKNSSNKMAKLAASAIVKRTLERCHKFEDTGKSCFSEPLFREMFLRRSSYQNGVGLDTLTNGESATLYLNSTSHSSEARFSATASSQPSPRTSRLGLNAENNVASSPDLFPHFASHLSEQDINKEDPWSNRMKKRELLLDDVGGSLVGNSPTGPSGIGGSLPSSIKGKRSERDREGKGHNREVVSRGSTNKIGRPALSNAKDERNSKAKPKQKAAQLSVSVNGLVGKIPEHPKPALPSEPMSSSRINNSNSKEKDALALDVLDDPEDIVFSNLMGIDDDGQGNDLGAWLNIDDDGLQDHDFMGLEIPMDDLSDLNMMV